MITFVRIHRNVASMVLRVRSVILFVATLWTMIVLSHSESADYDDVESDEEDNLREALLLIKLIRSGTPANSPLIADLFSKNSNSLSAPSLPNAPQHPMNVPSFRNVLRSIPNTRRNAQPKLYRRRMAKNYYGVDSYENIETNTKMKPVLYRRQDYEDMFGPHPPATPTTAASTTTTVATTTGANPITTIAATISTTAASDSPPTKSPTTTSETKVNAKATAPRKKTKKKIKLSITKQPNTDATNQTEGQNTGIGKTPQENDPITHQVESELKNEMKGVLSAKKEAWKFTKQNNKAITITKPPSTLRIHLESSIRYPIPFPENHALCFTDPQNGLCRTPI